MKLGVNQTNIVVCLHVTCKLVKKIQPAVPTFLAVVIPFVVRGDWKVAFCTQKLFPQKSQSSRTKLNQMQPNSELELKHDFKILVVGFPFFFLRVLSRPFLFFLYAFNRPLKAFKFSDNLSDNLAITFHCKRNPGEVLDSFDPSKKNSMKKTNRLSTIGHHVVLRLG